MSHLVHTSFCFGSHLLFVLVHISFSFGQKEKVANYLSDFFVGVLGLEPRMTGPESVVLPLHHTPILGCNRFCFRFAVAKVLLFCEPPKLFLFFL